MNNKTKVSNDNNPKKMADDVLGKLIKVTAQQVKGVHDAHMTIVSDKAYIVYEANDIQPGERAEWTFIYCAMSIVNIKTNTVEKIIRFAESEQQYDNESLPVGCCFVPRIIQKDENTLRIYFASEHPYHRQSDTWYIDFDLNTQKFCTKIYKMKLKTRFGIFDMQPQYFYEQAAVDGFNRPTATFALYLLELGKKIDGKYYVALNNFITGQNALGLFNDELDMVEVIGNYNEPLETTKLTESGVNKTPCGKWLAIIRNDMGDLNYYFSESTDGIGWSIATEKDFITNGSNSKPTFDKFGDTYYLGWQEKPNRTKFNIDISKDCNNWTREFSFDVPNGSFQYPAFYEYEGVIYVCVTQGDKERIMFGKLK
jgi:hypothetical protein